MRLLGLPEDKINKIGGYNTCFEMANQPNLWLEGVRIIEENKKQIEDFINHIYSIHNLKIYLVGAGSSAKAASITESYIGKISGKKVISVPSTSLILQPENYISQEEEVLLVSFGGSGNTTEGLETVNIFKSKCKKVYQILIICSPEGEIIKRNTPDKDVLYIPIPKGTKGKSFAATGEFTLLVQYALMIFDISKFDYYKKMFNEIVKDSLEFFDKDIYKVHAVSNGEYDTIAALGSCSLCNLASEMSLKVSELSAGFQNAEFYSVLEFRHGPKLRMNKNILLTFLFSNNDLTIKYEIDMLKECYRDKKKSSIAAVSINYNKDIDENSDYYFYFNRNKFNYIDDSHIIFQYSLFFQSVAILKSINLGFSPDMPDNTGAVNKVAQGVIIYSK